MARLQVSRTEAEALAIRLVERRCRADPVAFARAIGIEPDAWQQKVLTSKSSRKLLKCSRQVGKSTIASVKAIHAALFRPDFLALLISPSLRQSAELFRKVADDLERVPNHPKLTEDNKLSLRLPNGSRVVSLPSSEATVRGFSKVNLVIEDEAARVPDALHNAIRPMLATSKGELVLLSSPFGKRGHFYEAWVDGGDDWERFEVRASECSRIPADFLAQERRALGERWYRQEYECSFEDMIGQVFSSEAIEAAVRDDVMPLFEQLDEPGGVQPLFGGT